MPAKKENQKRSNDRRRKRQWDLLCKRADNWFKDCPENPSVVLMMLQGKQVVYKAPEHMQNFCMNADVIKKFKDVALQRRLNFNATELSQNEPFMEPMQLPFYDPSSYTWDILVFIIPQILRNMGIKGKSSYCEANKPAWWPDGLRFCSPNSGPEHLNVNELRQVLLSFMENCPNMYTIFEADTGPCTPETADTGPGMQDMADTGLGMPDPADTGLSTPDTADTGPDMPDTADTGPDMPDTADTGPGMPDTADTGPGTPDMADTGLDTPDNADTGLGTPDTADTEPGTPDTADTGPGMPDTADTGLGRPDTADSGLGTPNTADTELGTPDTANTGLGMPDTADTGPCTPETADTGLGTPDTADTGLGMPDRADTGMGTPDTADTGMGTPDTADTGMGTPDTADTGLGRPTTADTGLGTPDTGMGIRHTADTGLGTPDTADTGLGTPDTADTGLGKQHTADTGLGRQDTADTGSGTPDTADTEPATPDTADTGLGMPHTADTGLGRPTTADTGPGTPDTADTGLGMHDTADTGPGTPDRADTGPCTPDTADTKPVTPDTADTGLGMPDTGLGTPDTAADHLETCNKVLKYAKTIFSSCKREMDFLFTCCEGIKLNLHSMYSIRNKITDEIIDCFTLTLLRKHESSIQYINCSIMSMLLSPRHQSAMREHEFVAREAMGIFNVGHRHWILIIIKLKSKDITVIDPLGENNLTLKKIFSSWMSFLKLKEFSQTELNLWSFSTVKHPKQQDSNSCGVFCLMFAEKYMIGEDLQFHCPQEDVFAYRQYILQSIVQNPDESLILKLCRICCKEEPKGRKKDNDIDWVGCEKCGMYWCHFVCIKTSDTISQFISKNWICRFCSLE